MADFRRVVTALAVVVLLVGLVSTANAQPSGPAFGCTAQAAVPPLLRAEGLTELTGDVVLNCTGGVAIAAGAAVPTANFAVFLGNTQVTSRIYDSSGTSEALLLVDEPGTTINPTAAFVYAPSALTGCSGVTGGCVAGATLPNVYRGLVSGNSVTFIGVPVNPPGTSGTRIFRITNVRANASTIGAGPGGTPGQVQAFVSISGSTSIPVSNPTQITGFVQTGLAFSLRKTDDSDALSSSGFKAAQCSDLSKGWIARARFAEQFATAFKVQGTAGGVTGTAQTIPGAIYNTESGLTIGGGASGYPANIGLADSGTRLRVTFNNVPAGATIYVSTTNVGGVAGTAPYAVLIASETAGNIALNTPFTLTNTTTVSSVNAFALTAVSGTASAVWEVTAASSLAKENFDFYIGASWTGNAAGNSPAAGVQGTVSGSFAPAPPAISATDGAKASQTLPIPRFIDSGSAKNVLIASICRTNLLFPFVTNQAGFDTGLAVANTSTDPFGTTAQSGTCTLNFYGANAPAAYTSSGPIASGTVATWLASAQAPNFQGYVIAVCNFQYGHGFAFVSDVGARNLAMGYLALVMDTPGTYRGSAGGEGLTQ